VLRTKFDDDYALMLAQQQQNSARQAQEQAAAWQAQQARQQHEMAMQKANQDFSRDQYQAQKADTDRKNEGLLKLAGVGGTVIGHTGKPGGLFRKSLLS